MALSQEEIAEAQKLYKRLEEIKEEIRVLSCRESDVRESVTKEIFSADQKYKKLDEELKRRRAKAAEAELLYVYLAGLCPVKGHKYISCKPKNEPETRISGIVWDRQCSHCGVSHFTLFFATGTKNSLRFADEGFMAPVKEPAKIERILTGQQLRRRVLNAEKKIHRLEKEKDAIEKRRNRCYEKNDKKANRRAGQLVRGIKRKICELEEERKGLEIKLNQLQKKCRRHRWSRDTDVFDIKCKLCGILACHVKRVLNTIPGRKGLPKLPR